MSIEHGSRRHCLDCCNDQAAEVRRRMACGCPFWPDRMGRNPAHQTIRLPEEKIEV